MATIVRRTAPRRSKTSSAYPAKRSLSSVASIPLAIESSSCPAPAVAPASSHPARAGHLGGERVGERSEQISVEPSVTVEQTGRGVSAHNTAGLWSLPQRPRGPRCASGRRARAPGPTRRVLRGRSGPPSRRPPTSPEALSPPSRDGASGRDRTLRSRQERYRKYRSVKPLRNRCRGRDRGAFQAVSVSARWLWFRGRPSDICDILALPDFSSSEPVFRHPQLT